MRYIATIIDDINEELKSAEHYIQMAIEHPQFASQYKKMAQAELDHSNLNHSIVVEIINDYKSKNNEPPKEMLAIWDYEHKKAIEYLNELKYKLSQLNN